jgi:hypothetical protein
MIDKNNALYQAPVGLEQTYRELFRTLVPEYEKHLLPAFAYEPEQQVAVRTVTTYGAFEVPIVG